MYYAFDTPYDHVVKKKTWIIFSFIVEGASLLSTGTRFVPFKIRTTH